MNKGTNFKSSSNKAKTRGKAKIIIKPKREDIKLTIANLLFII